MKRIRLILAAMTLASLAALPISLAKADWYDGSAYDGKSLLACYVDLYVCGWKGC